jgi:hypothetical protein
MQVEAIRQKFAEKKAETDQADESLRDALMRNTQAEQAAESLEQQITEMTKQIDQLSQESRIKRCAQTLACAR